MHIYGAGSKATTTDCKFEHNQSSNVQVSDGASADLASCTASGSSAACGLLVKEAGSSAAARDCQFYDNQFSNVQVSNGAWVDLAGCSMRGSKTACGMAVGAGAGSRAVALSCTLEGNTAMGVVCNGGGTVMLGGACSMNRSEKGHLVVAKDARSRVLMSKVTPVCAPWLAKDGGSVVQFV
jgi:hypothetical protein